MFFESLIRERHPRKKNHKLQERLQEVETFSLAQLLEILQDDNLLMRHKQENIPLRVKAIQVLADRGDAGNVPCLIELLRDDALLVQQEAICALGKLNDSRAIEPLMRVFRAPASSSIQTHAKAALLQLGVAPETLSPSKMEPSAEQDEPQDITTQALLMQLHHADWRVRKRAVEALGQHEDPAIVKPLLGCLTDADWEVRLQAVHVLQTFRDDRITEALVMMMRDNVAEVSNAAVRFTESLGIQAIKPLATLLGATDVRVRENAVRLLSRLRDTAVIELLLRALSDSDAQVRQLATDALLGIGQPVFDALAEAAESPDGKIRWKAVDAMMRLQDTRATHTLVNVLEDYEADIREMAANTLQELGWRPQTPQQHMAYAIAHRNWEALTSFGAQAILPLLNFVNEKDVRIRRYIHQKLSQACLQVKSVAFGEDWQQPFEEQSTLHNIDVAALSMPFSKLQRLYIHAETYDFYLTERFMTYAVNVLGEKLLKKQVHVYVLGNPEQLNPNLLNMFKNLCKSVRFESA